MFEKKTVKCPFLEVCTQKVEERTFNEFCCIVTRNRLRLSYTFCSGYYDRKLRLVKKNTPKKWAEGRWVRR